MIIWMNQCRFCITIAIIRGYELIIFLGLPLDLGLERDNLSLSLSMNVSEPSKEILAGLGIEID